MTIFVVNFKLAGPESNLAEGWRLIRGDANNEGGTGLIMEDPTPLGHYLGCNHVQGTVTLPNGNVAKTVTYDMDEFLASCVARCTHLATEITGVAPKMRAVGTPIIEDSPGGSPSGSPCAPTDTPSVFCPWCNNHFPIAGNQRDHIATLRKVERERAKAQQLLDTPLGCPPWLLQSRRGRKPLPSWMSA